MGCRARRDIAADATAHVRRSERRGRAYHRHDAQVRDALPAETTSLDEVGDQLVGWGKVVRIETRGRVSGRLVEVAVGYVDEPDGSLLVAAGSADADWGRNLEAEPTCRVTIGEATWAAIAEPLLGTDAHRAVRELILRYGTPAERLGAGPVFRLRKAGVGRARP